MSTVIKALIVEDSEDDAVLLAHALKAGGYDPVFQRVDTAETMRAALARNYWDVVFSDFSMPQFSAQEALQICRESELDAPFILVSGKIGEEAAVEMMKRGAHDYVRKDDLRRLLPALNRELKSAYDRLTRRRAEHMTAHLASIVASCKDAVISQTVDGIILSWNRGAEEMYGYLADEMIGQSIAALLPANSLNELTLQMFHHDEPINRLETVRRCKDGRLIDVSLTVSPIRDTGGKISAAAVIAQDITEQKQQEAERLTLIQELSEALARVKTLSGMLPICASCKKIRNDVGYWERVETYLQSHTGVEFTHGICPDCQQSFCSDLPKLAG